MAELSCDRRTTRDINAEIRRLVAAGEAVTVRSPGARHNLAVALLERGEVVFEGSVGYYCAGLRTVRRSACEAAPVGDWRSRC